MAEVMTEGAFINGALIGISENRPMARRAVPLPLWMCGVKLSAARTESANSKEPRQLRGGLRYPTPRTWIEVTVFRNPY